MKWSDDVQIRAHSLSPGAGARLGFRDDPEPVGLSEVSEGVQHNRYRRRGVHACQDMQSTRASGWRTGRVVILSTEAPLTSPPDPTPPMEPDYKNKSQTLFGVAIISGGFSLETLHVTRARHEAQTLVVHGIFFVVFVCSLVAGIVYHRRYKALTWR